MKKLLTLALAAGMVAFMVSCGPSQKEKDAKEKAKQDSIKAAEKAKKEADSLANVEKMKHMQDSLKMDSMAKANKGGGGVYNNQPARPNDQPAKPPVKKKGTGKAGVH
jgi:hypothetical protein